MTRTTFISSFTNIIKGAGLAALMGLLPATSSASPLKIILQGDFTIQQQSSGRYLDAHEGSHDNSVVTRARQSNTTQTWVFTPAGGQLYTIQQKSNGRYLDAHEG